MSLTGTPLLALAATTTIAAAGATALGWRRIRRARLLARPTAILLTEALVLLTTGLAVNRQEQYYTSWTDLLDTRTHQPGHHDNRPGQLDRWLAHHTTNPDTPTTVDWKPPGWQRWRLTHPPTLVVPAGYLRHPDLRYPAVLVVTDDDRWTPTEEQHAAHATTTTPAVLIFTPPADPDVLTDALPAALTRDLRVTDHSWALVTTTHHQALARAVAHTTPDRYPALALIDDDPTHRTTTDLPDTTTLAVTGPATTPTGARPTHLPPGPDRGLTTALRWACQQTPTPLAAPTPLTPPAAHTRHPDPPTPANTHVTRQPHR